MDFAMADRQEQIMDCIYSHDKILKGLANIESGCQNFLNDHRDYNFFFKFFF